MKNILVVAYQLHYSAGSEYAVAMDYINHMSKNNKLTVLYGTCNQFHKIGNTREMEEWVENNPIKNVKFVPVLPSFISSNTDSSILGSFIFYREYRKWHKDAFDIGLKIHKKHPFDLVHYLGPIGYREPGMMQKLNIPYLRGPIGGFGMINPLLFKAAFSFSGYFSLLFKGVLNVLQYHLDYRVRRSFCETDLILCATNGWKQTVEKLAHRNHHSKILYLPENCINKFYPLNFEKFNNSTVNLIFIGWLNSRKALILLLDALRKVRCKEKIKLHVIGEGPLKIKYKKWTDKNGLSKMIIYHGKIPRENVFSLLNDSHLMCMPSLIDANTTVIWEAMSMCVPTLALDHFGFHDTILNNQTGFLIPVTTYKQIVDDIARTINDIVDNPKILKDISEEVLKHREKYSWDKRIEEFEEIYNLTIKNHNNEQ